MKILLYMYVSKYTVVLYSVSSIMCSGSAFVNVDISVIHVSLGIYMNVYVNLYV